MLGKEEKEIEYYDKIIRYDYNATRIDRKFI